VGIRTFVKFPEAPQITPQMVAIQLLANFLELHSGKRTQFVNVQLSAGIALRSRQKFAKLLVIIAGKSIEDRELHHRSARLGDAAALLRYELRMSRFIARVWLSFLLDEMNPLMSVELDESSLSVSGSDSDEFLDDDDGDVALFLTESLKEFIFHGDDAKNGSHGGSIPGREANVAQDFDAELDGLKHNYFGLNGARPLYNDNLFARRFGIPRAVFDMIFASLRTRREFRQRKDALGKSGIHGLQRITGAMRILRYGTACDAVDEVVSVSETVMSNVEAMFSAITAPLRRPATATRPPPSTAYVAPENATSQTTPVAVVPTPHAKSLMRSWQRRLPLQTHLWKAKVRTPRFANWKLVSSL
jgi:hypothetical protein